MLCIYIPYLQYEILLQPHAAANPTSSSSASFKVSADVLAAPLSPTACTCKQRCPVHQTQPQHKDETEHKVHNIDLSSPSNAGSELKTPVSPSANVSDVMPAFSVLNLEAPSQDVANHDRTSHTLLFPARMYEPIISERWWNSFLFHERRRTRFIRWAFVNLAMILIVEFLPQSETSILLLCIAGTAWLVVVLFAFFHTLDVRYMQMLLARWEIIYFIGYLILFCVCNAWLGFSTGGNVYYLIIGTVAHLLSYLYVLFSDSCPQTVFPRSWKMIIYLIAAIETGSAWLTYGILQTSTSTEICLFVCMPIERLFAACALNLALFCIKFALSLLIWPDAAVVLKARIHLKNC